MYRTTDPPPVERNEREVKGTENAQSHSGRHLTLKTCVEPLHEAAERPVEQLWKLRIRVTEPHKDETPGVESF